MQFVEVHGILSHSDWSGFNPWSKAATEGIDQKASTCSILFHLEQPHHVILKMLTWSAISRTKSCKLCQQGHENWILCSLKASKNGNLVLHFLALFLQNWKHLSQHFICQDHEAKSSTKNVLLLYIYIYHYLYISAQHWMLGEARVEVDLKQDFSLKIDRSCLAECATPSICSKRLGLPEYHMAALEISVSWGLHTWK